MNVKKSNDERKGQSMKFRRVLLLLSIIVCLSCEQSVEQKTDQTVEPSHDHTFSETWSNNESHHWHQATCEHIDLISDYSEHIFEESEIVQLSYTEENVKYKCKICGYEKNVKKQREHDITIWLSDTGWVKTNKFEACKSEGIYIYCNKLAYFNGYLDEKDLKYYYTLDGSEPTKESQMIPAMDNEPCCYLVIEESCILKIFASKGDESSSIETFDITVKLRVPKPVISTENDCKFLGAGELITITCSLDEAKIYYTLDGDNPSESSNLYTEPFYIYQNCTINAIAVKTNYLNSNKSIYYVNDTIAPSYLQNVSIDHISETSINIFWDNPPESDYDGCKININGTIINKTKNETSCLLENLAPYTINKVKIQTYDRLGNISIQRDYQFMTFAPAKPTEKGESVIPEYYAIVPYIYVKNEDNSKNTVTLYAWHNAVIGQCEYTWYRSVDNISWVQIGTGQDISIEILDGINYYCASIKNTDTIAYTNSCKIDCNSPIIQNIGKIYYKDGTISSEYHSEKEVLGVVCNINPDGSVKNILNLMEESNIKFSSRNDILGDGKATSMIDGKRNTDNLQTANDFSLINYPALASCLNTSSSEGLFIPSIQEINEAICNHGVIDNTLRKLKQNGLEISLVKDDSHNDSSKGYWSSSVWYGYSYWFHVYIVNHDDINLYCVNPSLTTPYSLDTLRLMYKVQ